MTSGARETLLKLASHLIMSQAGTDILLCGDVILKFQNCSPGCIEFLHRLRVGLSRAEIEATTVDPDCKEVAHTLTKMGYLVADQDNPWIGEIFAKHFFYFTGIGLDPLLAQRTLLDSHVVLLGLGGIGTIILQHLVGAGVGRYTLIDCDVVEATNLNRQFVYTRNDIGGAKVAASAAYIRARFPSARIETRVAAVRSSADLNKLALHSPIAFLVNGADHPTCEVVEAVAEFCIARDLPFLDGGCGFLDGRFGPLVSPGEGRTYLDWHRLAVAKAAALGAADETRVQPVSFGPLNTVVGALMARDVIEHLIGGDVLSRGHYVWIDLRQTRILRVPAWTRSGEES